MPPQLFDGEVSPGGPPLQIDLQARPPDYIEGIRFKPDDIRFDKLHGCIVQNGNYGSVIQQHFLRVAQKSESIGPIEGAAGPAEQEVESPIVPAGQIVGVVPLKDCEEFLRCGQVGQP